MAVLTGAVVFLGVILASIGFGFPMLEMIVDTQVNLTGAWGLFDAALSVAPLLMFAGVFSIVVTAIVAVLDA